MIKKTLITATAVAALSTTAFAGDATLAGTNDDEIVMIPAAVPAGSSAGLLGSAGGAVVPAILGAALLAAALSSGGSS